jgi:hypothetical protein
MLGSRAVSKREPPSERGGEHGERLADPGHEAVGHGEPQRPVERGLAGHVEAGEREAGDVLDAERAGEQAADAVVVPLDVVAEDGEAASRRGPDDPGRRDDGRLGGPGAAEGAGAVDRQRGAGGEEGVAAERDRSVYDSEIAQRLEEHRAV